MKKKKIFNIGQFQVKEILDLILNPVLSLPGSSNGTVKREDRTHVLIEWAGTAYKVNNCSMRLRTFKKKGTRCVKCGLEGSYFVLTFNPTLHNPHFNLFASNGTLMTQDHILPLSKGGKDSINNSQTMCIKCNIKKSNKIEDPCTYIKTHSTFNQAINNASN